MKLETYFEKYNYPPLTPEQIVEAVILYEIGFQIEPIARKFWPDIDSDRARIIMRKVFKKYTFHTGKTNMRGRRKHWMDNSLVEFISELNQKVGASSVDIQSHFRNQVRDIELKTIKNQYNPNDHWFRHYTAKNRLAYNAQKSMALKRGVGWEFHSFEEWLLWWLQTGKFEQRGVHNHEYQMCRKLDQGAYSWDNVYCDTGENNKLDKKEFNKIKKGATK